MEEIKINRYRCVKEFQVELYDEDCRSIDGEYAVIKIGSTWEKHDFLLGIGDIHLDNVNRHEWIEIPVAYLTEYFKQIENN